MSFRLLLAISLLVSTSQIWAAEKVRIVTFSTILTEIAQQVGGGFVQVDGLIQPGVDPHEYEPSPSDLKLVGDSQLVLLSAKHMEGYVSKLKQATSTQGAVIEVGDRFPSLKMMPGGEAAKQHVGPDGTVEDPHWWHSIDNMRRATKVVQDELIRIAPAQQTQFAAQGAAYLAQLNELESWSRTEIAKLPRSQRKLVTSHDAFQYFAKSFGFTVYPIEGVSPEDQPSSRQVADLIALIKKEKVKAIFLESIENPKVATEITRETGAKIGGTLYADGIGTGDVGTYAGMFRHNVSTIVDALR